MPRKVMKDLMQRSDQPAIRDSIILYGCMIVFAGIGVPYDSAEYFRRSLEQGGALERTALFLNLASDSSTQRLLVPGTE